MPAARSRKRASTAETLAEGRALMAGHAAVLRALELYATQLHARGEYQAAVAWAEIAGDFAFRNHPGRFSSPGLEALLADVGARLTPPLRTARAPVTAAGGVERVLHVLSEGYTIGGHTRLARRWIELDRAREHTVLLTMQRAPVPEHLRTAAEASGGRLLQLPGGQGVFARAGALRQLAAEADVVVLHDHMHDVVPSLAFATREDRPPVVTLDHADHMFWLGTGAIDALAELRHTSCTLAEQRRGMPPEDLVLLPIPLAPLAEPPDRAAARERLGIAPGAQVVLSIAAAFKFAPVLDDTFAHLAHGLLEARPQAQLFVAGPQPQEAGFERLARRFRGRAHILGPVEGIADLYAAADVYLDSYPAGSGTSVLEAALYGLPVVAYRPDMAGYAGIAEQGPGLEPEILRCETPAAWREAILGLLADPAGCRAKGEATRRSVEEIHVGERWQRALEAAYERVIAARAQPRRRLPVADPEPPLDWEAVLTMLFRAQNGRIPLTSSIISNHLDLPAPERPTTNEEVARLARWTGAARMRPDAAETGRALAELRAFAAAGLLRSPIVLTAAEAELEPVAALIEQDLAAHGDLDVTLVPSDEEPLALLDPGVRPLVVS